MGGRNPFSSTRRPLSLSNDRSGGSSPSRRPIEALLGRIRDSRMHSLVDLFQYPVQHPDALPGRAWDFRLGCWSVVYLLSTCFFDLFSVVREPTMSPPTSLKNLPESVSALLGMRSCRNHATTQVSVRACGPRNSMKTRVSHHMFSTAYPTFSTLSVRACGPRNSMKTRVSHHMFSTAYPT